MDIFAKARAKRAELLEQLQRIDTFLEVAENLADDPDVGSHEEVKLGPETVGPLVQHTRNLVVSILRETGRPMGREELLEALRQRGHAIDKKDPGGVLYTRLYKAPEVMLLRGMGWELRERAAASIACQQSPPDSDPGRNHTQAKEPSAGSQPCRGPIPAWLVDGETTAGRA